jgi:predicted nucleotidyltransferase
MANILNEDFTDFIKALNNSHVEYILVGGYAVIYHGYNRTTGDLDIWVNPTSENFKRLELAFSIFGMSLFGITEDKFLNTQSYDVFTFGRPPVCVEILTKVKGLDFKSTFSNSVFTKFDGIDVQMIDIRDLRIAKSAANRPKDNDDLQHLT